MESDGKLLKNAYSRWVRSCSSTTSGSTLDRSARAVQLGHPSRPRANCIRPGLDYQVSATFAGRFGEVGDVTEVPPPDLAAMYQKHRDAMYRVAARTLRDTGRASEADDVVMMAIESLMKKPPRNVKNWEAMMVQVTKFRALDLLKSGSVKHASGAELLDHDGASEFTVEDDVIEAVDRQRAACHAWDKLSILDERHRYVAWEFVAKQRPRGEVAAELNVSPARVSQMATKALKELKEALEKEGVTP